MEKSTYLKINSQNDVDLQNILNDFINCFCNGYVEVKTKYKKLPVFKISFHKNNLPHLLGLHYTQNNVSAKKIIGRITEGKITHESIKKNHEYNNIKDRLINYNFLHKCFIDREIKLCVIVPKHSINPQKIDVAFIDDKNSKLMILGLKKGYNSDFFIPATMYILGKNSSYRRMRRTDIIDIEWKK
ncbi:PBECR4 domain-containing protein [Staphylococcus pasteuri]|uniref:PBECR4 domain-containing protein n=1 Tax=Staphylococcus pasteuri TaxID=45972 RepID=UPI0012B970A3|nr:PBECR4 domain-containing protein [Staphylococcus pasteuri]